MPGGVDAPLAAETRDRILAAIPDAIAAIERALAWYKASWSRCEDEAASFGDFRSAFMALVDRDGKVDHYDGWLRVMDADGHAPRRPASTRADYADYLGEAVEPWSYLKSTYWKPLGYPDGHLPGRSAGAADRGRPHRHAARRCRAGASSARASAGARAAPSTTTTRG